MKGIFRLWLLHLEQPANLHSAFGPRQGASLAEIGLGQRGCLILLILRLFHFQGFYLFYLRAIRHGNLALFGILFHLPFATVLACLTLLTFRSDGTTALFNTELLEQVF